MHQHSGTTNTAWRETPQLPAFPPLTRNETCDVCVVGAGIAGLMTAYHLARVGRSVIVLDDGPIAGGETERTTAHLANAMDDRFYHLEKIHGRDGARLAAESHGAAIARLEAVANEEGIECDFTRLDGFLFLPPGASAEQLRREFEAAQRAGIAVEALPRAPLPFFNTGPTLLFPNQGQFHPLKFLGGLAAAIQRRGGRLFCDTRVVDVTGGSPARVRTAAGPAVECGAVVVATNSPVNDRYVIHTKQAAYRTYVVGLAVPAGAVPLGLYWDTAQDAGSARHDRNASYHYVRLERAQPGAPGEPQRDLLIVGGEDHKTGQAQDAAERWAALEYWTRERFPMAGEVLYRWSGQVMETMDGLAFIGRNPGDEPNVFICTGDSGQGMTHGAIAGMLLTDLILDRPNPWAALYDPSRVRVRASGDFVKENLNVAAQYRDYVVTGKPRSQPTPGQGMVVRSGTSLVAVYRDDTGQDHAFSAICPHLKCVVQWNPAEKSWDCPCHGSRFTCFGEVINGPATVNLSRAEWRPKPEPARSRGET